MEQTRSNTEESWSQSIITVSPEDNPVLREIKDEVKISANIKDPFDICEKDFSFRVFLHKDIIDRKELEQEPTRDAGNQTFLQGVPVVVIPVEYREEVAQTTYTRTPRGRVDLKRIATSVNQPMPQMRINRESQTAISIPPSASRHGATEQLSTGRQYEKRRNPSPSQNQVDTETIIEEIFNYLLSLVFWIVDPTMDPVETECQEAQTEIRYDFNTGEIILDAEAQTDLTCEPRYSNSKLLAEYEETKSFVRSCLQECFVKGVEPRIIIDNLLGEIIAKGADRLKYPMRHQVIQTVASYRSHEDGDEDVLRKLKTPVVVDPFEASIVVVPLIDDLLRLACHDISRDARSIVKRIFGSLMQRAVLIGFKLAESQLKPRSIEQILDQRRKKLIESTLERKKSTAATQTQFAGVPDVAKFKEPKEVLCSVCVRESICHWCEEAREEDMKSLPKEDAKILRTQDILLPYNPCYVVATASEEAKNPHLQPAAGLTTKRKNEKQFNAQLSTLRCVTSKEARTDSNETIKFLMTPKKNIQTQDSVSGWARIVDGTLAKSWSPRANSASNATSITATSSATDSISKSYCKKSSQSESILGLQVTRALQILKSTFCTRDTCPATFLTTLREHHLPSEGANDMCNLQNCALLNLDQCCKRPINNANGQICARPRADKFRAVLTRPLSKSDNDNRKQ